MVFLSVERLTYEEAITEADAAILRLPHPIDIKTLQYGDPLFAKAICAKDGLYDCLLNHTFI